jgi:hypothetical protein
LQHVILGRAFSRRRFVFLVLPPDGVAVSLVAGLLGLASCTSSPLPPAAERPEGRPAEGVVTATATATTEPIVTTIPTNEPTSSADGGGPPTPAKNSCPGDMILVEGSYCPNVQQECLRYLDPPGRYGTLRCAEFKQPASCIGERQPMRFCIDREEFTDPSETRPRVHVSWTQASALCRARDARLCLESEWQFAGEGEERRPYPYGFARDSTACNIDQTHLGRPEEGLKDLRAPVSEFPRCASPFGVHDLTGNVDEWTERPEAVAPNRSILHGGWWLPARNSCRGATSHHNEAYFGGQVGFRCCRGVDPG